MRTWAFNAVKSCPDQAAFAAGRVYSSGAADGMNADSPTKPFIVLRFAVNNPPLPRMPGTRIRQQDFQVWLHKEPGSMLDLDELLESLQEWVPAQAPAVSGNYVIMDCVWNDSSSDSWDDHFNTETRYASFTATFRGPIA